MDLVLIALAEDCVVSRTGQDQVELVVVLALQSIDHVVPIGRATEGAFIEGVFLVGAGDDAEALVIGFAALRHLNISLVDAAALQCIGAAAGAERTAARYGKVRCR